MTANHIHRRLTGDPAKTLAGHSRRYDHDEPRWHNLKWSLLEQVHNADSALWPVPSMTVAVHVAIGAPSSP